VRAESGAHRLGGVAMPRLTYEQAQALTPKGLKGVLEIGAYTGASRSNDIFENQPPTGSALAHSYSPLGPIRLMGPIYANGSAPI
jgi:hypothetical protein